MEDFKNYQAQTVELLKKLDQKTDDHSHALKQISENTKVMTNIDSAIERIAVSLESSNTRADDMTKSAMGVLNGKNVIGVRTHVVSMLIMGVMFVICIIAIAGVDFRGEGHGMKASINQHD